MKYKNVLHYLGIIETRVGNSMEFPNDVGIMKARVERENIGSRMITDF